MPQLGKKAERKAIGLITDSMLLKVILRPVNPYQHVSSAAFTEFMIICLITGMFDAFGDPW